MLPGHAWQSVGPSVGISLSGCRCHRRRTLTKIGRVSVGTVTEDLPRPKPQRGAPPPSARAMLADPVILALAGLTAVGAVLRFTRLGYQGFWFDEGNTALLIHFSPGKMLGLIPQTESTPPLYYCLAWVWARIFGYGEAGLRSLSALAGVLTVPVMYAAVAKLLSRRAGLIAAALTACNPYLVWYSQEARSYALLVLLSAASVLAFAYAQAKPTPRTLAAWVIASGLALATHYYAVLVVVPLAGWLLFAHRRTRAVQLAVGAVALCGLALIPLATSQNGTGHASWIAPIPLTARLEQIFPQFLKGYQAPAQGVLYPIAFALVALALVLAAVRSNPRERRVALAIAGLTLGGLVLNLVLVAVGIDDLITRNVIALWVPGAMLVAAGLGVRRAGAIGLVGAATLCAIGIVATVGVATNRNFQRPDWRVVARVLGPRPAPGAPGRAILVQHYKTLLPLSLYEPQLKFWPHGNRAIAVSELDVVSFTAPRVHLCWWGAACNLSPSGIQSSYPIAGFRIAWTRSALQFTVMRLVAARPVLLTPGKVRSVLSATSPAKDELLVQR
jgi:mannosyltransferase